MKNFFITVSASLLILAGCKGPQLTSDTDDVYANPAEERAIARAAAEQKERALALERQKQAEQAEQEKLEQEKENNNPYYKDPSYESDDYYDYEYAARINRFHRPVYGAGFYDPFYTNMYTYNQNPMFWGTSIYSSYGYGMPSSQFGYYSLWISSGWGYNNMWNNCGWGYYDPFCYNTGFYMGYGYNPWGYNSWGYNSWAYQSGYNQGYFNGWNNSQWYYNAMDPNSGYGKVSYGPRNSNIGGNTDPRRSAGARVEEFKGRRSYIETVAEEQEKQPRFSTPTGNRRIDNPGRTTERGGERRTANPAVNPEPQRQQQNVPQNRRRSNPQRIEQQPRQQQSEPHQRQQQTEPRQQQSEPRQNSERSSGSSWNQAPSNSGSSGRSSGSSSPRSNSGGSNSRPRR